MIRSLYSGVAGMTTHQSRMDVIGNNIANVSTYGYKSSRATFRDVYYQTTSDASAATAAKGGVNPTQIGYGSTLGSVDVNHSQSTMSTTGYALDVAIAGEGYFQVMDGNGNIFYTKAGMFDIDAAGNFVDVNGNFVLGVSGSPTNQAASSDRIKITLPYQQAAAASASDTVNGVNYTITSSNQTENANISFAFTSDPSLPIGQKAQATISSSSIVVALNANESFASLDELQTAMNEAITAANNGAEHPAGTFSIAMSDPSVFSTSMTGAQIANVAFGTLSGTVSVPPALSSFFSVKSVGDDFSGTGTADWDIALDADNNLTLSLGSYTATVSAAQLASAGSVVMKNAGSSTDSFVVSYPSLATINANGLAGITGASSDMTPSSPVANLGFSSLELMLAGGTAGGEQTVADLTGISIGTDGVITASHPTLGLLELGRIDLATFSNPAGLAQIGDTYFAESRNSGGPILAKAGSENTGDLAAGTLESSNVDLSREFADMITTQRGFQACSRMITVSDTMLEELINLKR